MPKLAPHSVVPDTFLKNKGRNIVVIFYNTPPSTLGVNAPWNRLPNVKQYLGSNFAQKSLLLSSVNVSRYYFY